jgi:Flp pilus assembly pilin Flp
MKPTKKLEARRTRKLSRDEKGGTDFVELLIMVALIAFVVIAGVQTFGQSVMNKFTEQSGSVDGI